MSVRKRNTLFIKRGLERNKRLGKRNRKPIEGEEKTIKNKK
jgi:hypothetical protein